MTIGELKPGDSYGNEKYKVLSNQYGIIKIVRNDEGKPHYITFHDKQPNWNWKVVKDDKLDL